MANVYSYSLARDGDKKLSNHFRVREFRCKDGSDKILICMETVIVLEAVRDYFGKPITITSGYRTASHNKAVGGATTSQHVVGTAVDFKVQDIPTWAVVAFLEDNYPTHGIGLYSKWVHLDSRGYGSYWIEKGSNTTKSFGYKRTYYKYKAQPIVKEKEMTIDEIKTALLKDEGFCIKAAEIYAEKVRKTAAGGWSEPARKWAIQNGVFTQDSEWRAPLTREQAAQVFYNIERKNADDGK